MRSYVRSTCATYFCPILHNFFHGERGVLYLEILTEYVGKNVS